MSFHKLSRNCIDNDCYCFIKEISYLFFSIDDNESKIGTRAKGYRYENRTHRR